MPKPAYRLGHLCKLDFIMERVLSSEQIEQFITRGWTKIEAAFDPKIALECQDFLWGKLHERYDVVREDKATWKPPMAFIAENYNTPPFDGCATERLRDGVIDIIGKDRWVAENETGQWGWWPVNFSVGADQKWDVPGDQWHFDGPTEANFVQQASNGLLMICLFSSIGPRGGGTLIVEGSHQIVARYLAENPGHTQQEGIKGCIASSEYLQRLSACGEDFVENAWSSHRGPIIPFEMNLTPRIEEFMNATFTDEFATELRVIELTGEPGDVYLGHPLMFHSPSFNHSGAPRFMCNRKTPLFEDMKFEREDAEYSALEESIRRALKISVAS